MVAQAVAVDRRDPRDAEPDHLRENVAAASIELSDEQYAEIERIGRKTDQLRAQRK